MMIPLKRVCRALMEMHEDLRDIEEQIEDAIGHTPMIDIGHMEVEVEVEADLEVVVMMADVIGMVLRVGLSIEKELDPIKGVNTLVVQEEVECLLTLPTIEEEITEARVQHNLMMMVIIEEVEITMRGEDMYLTTGVRKEVESICIQDLHDPVALATGIKCDLIVSREVKDQVEVRKLVVIEILRMILVMISKTKLSILKMMIMM